VNLREIKEMINLMNENDLAELEIERGDLKVRIKKKIQAPTQVTTSGAGVPVAKVQAVETQLAKEPSSQENLIQVKAPMVGTFYRAPSPDADPYVNEGKEISPGDVLCIIEAMKLMNEIKSEVKGKIRQILVENGDPVEFGQVLFLVEPT
jgi:acetyl-CoA carboxylase biotin carboxyl carrier protein